MYGWIRLLILLVTDILLINVSYYMALILRFDAQVPSAYLGNYMAAMVGISLSTGIFFYVLGIYQRSWRYASIRELIIVTIATLVLVVSQSFFFETFMSEGNRFLPYSVYVMVWVLGTVLVGASRLAWRIYCYQNGRTNYIVSGDEKKVLLVGAGDAGIMIAKELRSHYAGQVKIVGFIDKDKNKQGMRITDIKVLGDRHDIVEIVKHKKVDEIIICIPSAAKKEIKDIVEICQETEAKIQILPGIFELIDGHVSLKKIRDVEVQDLLGRDPVQVDIQEMSSYLTNEVVMVTGAGGSIGSELCRQVAGFGPKKLLLLDNCENNVYEIEMELRKKHPELCLLPLVKDVKNRGYMEEVFAQYEPQVIFHAAAHKHVPLMEANPEEAIRNNVMGTYHVAKLAHEYKAKRFVMISTDKAVNPTSIMGASKRLAEILVRHLNSQSETEFATVRFGNVLGSKGSVVLLFKQQIAAGGPVTVTHPEMIRYFMTIPEAVELVIQAGAMAKGGEIFVLDMGEQVKITQLAETLIRLSGFEPYQDIDITFTGMRPGEKLYEELLTAEEGTAGTKNERIFVGRSQEFPQDMIIDLEKRIETRDLPKNEEETVGLIRMFLPEFRRTSAPINNATLSS